MAPPKPLLMIQAEIFADSLPSLCAGFGEGSDMILSGLGLDDRPVETVAVCREAPLPAIDAVSAIVVTGSVSMVGDPDPWIGRTAAFLRAAAAARLPTLGICFGHQLVAHALGGRVGRLASGPEYATVAIERTEDGAADPLLAGLPPTFAAQSAHYEAVLEPPPGATVIATGASGIQAMRVGSAWGVQFHPEFSAGAMRHLLGLIADRLAADGADVTSSLAGLAETPEAASVLARFGAIVRAA
jgi:GMP synthase (glutamine-hydrolysing)